MSHPVLYTAFVGEVSVRFVESPIKDAKPDFPWVVIDDLLYACGYDLRARKDVAALLYRDCRDRLRPVQIGTGRVVIAPQHIARDVLGAAVKRRIAHPSLVADFADAATAATSRLLGQMAEARAAAFLIAARQRWTAEEPVA